MISEVWAVAKTDTATPPSILYKLQAVEIFNPYGVNLSQYQLSFDGTNFIALPDATHEWYTVFTKTGNPPNMPAAPSSEQAGAPLIDFTSGKTIKLYRMATPDAGGSVNILVDQMTLDYTDPTDPDTEEGKGQRRDTSKSRQRYLVAVESEVNTGHTLGADNGLASGDIQNSSGEDVWEGYTIHSPDSTNGIVSLAETMDVFVITPTKESSNLKSLTQKLADHYIVYPGTGDALNAQAGASRGLANQLAQHSWSVLLPNLRIGCLLSEFFNIIPVDETRPNQQSGTDVYSRIYGRVNINTASAEVLKRLPWPETVNGIALTDAHLNEIVNYILDYRDRLDGSASGRVNYSTTPGEGFRTPGELVIPLADYSYNVLLGGVTSDDADFLPVLNELYRTVANLISVNSDTYGVYIAIRLPKRDGAAEYYTWNYVGVIDRSNCRASGDRPAVILFSPVK